MSVRAPALARRFVRLTARAGMGVVLAATLIAAALPSAARGAPTEPTARGSYVAVIDAGSSGSRIALFAASDAGAVTSLFDYKVPVPLSGFADRPGRAGPEGIEPLLDALDGYLADSGVAVAAVPVSVLATAGLRLVRRADPGAAAAIMASARAAVANSGHPVQRVRILPGQREALLAWLDLNSERIRAGRRTSGLVEVGGASAQVAFATRDPRARGSVTVAFAGHRHRIVALSYLGLGSNESRDAMQRSADRGRMCFPNSASGRTPRAYDAAALPIRATHAEFDLRGCRDAFAEVIGGVSARGVPSDEARDIAGFDRARFRAVGLVAYTMADFGAADAPRRDQALRRAALRACAGPDAWPRVVARYGGDTGPFAQLACSNASYALQFIFGARGLGINASRFTSSTSASASWSRGYALLVLTR